jgi:hypothetical protein
LLFQDELKKILIESGSDAGCEPVTDQISEVELAQAAADEAGIIPDPIEIRGIEIRVRGTPLPRRA